MNPYGFYLTPKRRRRDLPRSQRVAAPLSLDDVTARAQRRLEHPDAEKRAPRHRAPGAPDRRPYADAYVDFEVTR